jgi:hypothetical protein
MKLTRSLLAPSLALALGVAAPAIAQMDTMQHTTTTTEKTTTYKGVVSEVNPTSSTIILRSEGTSAPRTYTYNKETVFVDPSGNVVSYDVIKDSPVTVSYRQEGDRMIVTKVEATGPRVQRRETTTTTETR